MRIPRMTTRRWMIAVAVVGIILATGVQVTRRRDRCILQAEELEAFVEDLRYQRYPTRVGGPAYIALYQKKARAYRYAAYRPWLPVPPDPLSPK